MDDRQSMKYRVQGIRDGEEIEIRLTDDIGPGVLIKTTSPLGEVCLDRIELLELLAKLAMCGHDMERCLAIGESDEGSAPILSDA